MEGKVVMSSAQVKLYHQVQRVIEGKLSIRELSLIIAKSYRQTQRIVQKVKDLDYLGVLHGNSGNPPVNKTPQQLELEVIGLLKNKYSGFNLTHFREMIKDHEGIEIKKSTLERLARKHQVGKFIHRRSKKLHKPRARMPQEGMLVQFDGSPHNWFGGRRTDLLLAIDDATGKILAAEFFEGETSNNAMRVIKDVIDEYGIPEAFYMDQAGLYGKKDREWESQIARALQTINCRLIIAGSPQAKGRVERVFRTLQDRLVAELSFRGIKKMCEANLFLKNEFIIRFNKQFGVDAREAQKSFMPNVFIDLDMILCKKEIRKVANGNTFSWKGHTWLLDGSTNYYNRKLNINTHLDGTNSFDILGRKVKARKIERNYRYLKAG
jgi:transposase-like protein